VTLNAQHAATWTSWMEGRPAQFEPVSGIIPPFDKRMAAEAEVSKGLF
jgi:hypothetical protein